jgi:hypothetical protein
MTQHPSCGYIQNTIQWPVMFPNLQKKKQSVYIWFNLKIQIVRGELNSYCILPEMVGGKDTPISSNLLHGLEDVLSLSVLDLAHQFSPGFANLHFAHAGECGIRFWHIVANDGPLSNMHRR